MFLKSSLQVLNECGTKGQRSEEQDVNNDQIPYKYFNPLTCRCTGRRVGPSGDFGGCGRWPQPSRTCLRFFTCGSHPFCPSRAYCPQISCARFRVLPDLKALDPFVITNRCERTTYTSHVQSGAAAFFFVMCSRISGRFPALRRSPQSPT